MILGLANIQRNRRRFVTVMLVAVALFLWACGIASEETPSSRAPSLADVPLPPQPMSAAGPSDNIDTSFQDAILADGEVTYDEYERALYAMAECASEKGFYFLEGPERRGQILEFRLGRAVDQSGASVDAAQARDHLRLCHAQYFERVQLIWEEEVNGMTEQAREEARVAFIQCLRAAGHEVDSSTSDFSAFVRPTTGTPEMLKDFAECQERVTLALGIRSSYVP